MARTARIRSLQERLHSARSLRGGSAESGQAIVLLLGVVAAVLVGVLVLAAFGQALGASSRHQRAADLAAMSAAAAMREAYPRLFEPPALAGGCRTRGIWARSSTAAWR